MKETKALYTSLRWTIQRARTLAAGLSLAAALTACGSDATPGGTTEPPGGGTPVTPGTPAAAPTGSYDISTINAKSLPVAIAADAGVGYAYEVTSGTLTLTADAKYSAKLTYRQTLSGSVATFVDSTGGTWAVSGTTVTFTNSSDASDVSKADWQTGKLTFVVTELTVTNTYVYNKK